MKILRGLAQVRREHQGCVATIGNFDGMHRGHQAMVARLIALANQQQRPSLLISFEPLPWQFFGQDQCRLMSCYDKLHYLDQYTTIDYVLLLPFTHALAEIDAERFIRQILQQTLKVDTLLIGDDFHFGANRQGSGELLRRFGLFHVEQMPSLVVHQQRLSSSDIRQDLASQRLTSARDKLGRPYSLSGRVVRGDQLGRQLGFATANLHYPQPSGLQGVYVAHALLPDQSRHLAMVNIGQRPTVQGQQQRLEAHLLDFNGDLYQQRVHLDFWHFIRPEQRFASLEQLQHQLQQDQQATQQWWHHHSTYLPSRLTCGLQTNS